MKQYEILKELGLSEKEIKVFLTLIQRGEASAGKLAKLTSINRPTVYNVATSLVAKGLIAEDLAGKAVKYTALSPNSLNNLIQTEREALAKKGYLVEHAIKELSLIQLRDNNPVPKIRFIEEQKLKDYLYSEAEKWDKSTQEIDKTWWGFQDNTLIEQYEKWIHWLWKKVHKTTGVKLLSNDSGVERRIYFKYPKRHIKFWTRSNKFKTTTWIVGNYVIMLVTSRQPHYLVEIHDEMFADSQRNLFKGIWEEIQ